MVVDETIVPVRHGNQRLRCDGRKEHTRGKRPSDQHRWGWKVSLVRSELESMVRLPWSPMSENLQPQGIWSARLLRVFCDYPRLATLGSNKLSTMLERDFFPPSQCPAKVPLSPQPIRLLSTSPTIQDLRNGVSYKEILKTYKDIQSQTAVATKDSRKTVSKNFSLHQRGN